MKWLNKLTNPEWSIAFAVVALLLAGYSEAASVYSGTKTASQWIVKVEDGMVGDRIKILDDKARPIASGHILKRTGPSYFLVKVVKASQTIRVGYPVIVNNDSRSSSLQWAASFSGQD